MNLAERSQKSPSEEEVYQALRRSLQRRKGFGIVFVQCSPATATRLIARVKSDISQKKIAVLSLTEPIGNLYNLVEARPNKDELNILIIQGLEKSLEPYITPGYGGEGDYYTLSNLPPILGHLNQRRDGFLDRFPHLCFVFVLPLFAIKYLIQRSPDFFDWGGGIFEFPYDSELLEQESLRLVQEGEYDEYLSWTQPKRDRRIAEIQCWIGELNQTSERKAQLFLEQGNLFLASDEYEAAISSYDQALKLKPNDDTAWYTRGNALDELGRYQEAIDSYDRALVVNPDFDTALLWRSVSFAHLNLYQEAIESLDRALEIKPHDSDLYLFRGQLLKLWGQREWNKNLIRDAKELTISLQSALRNALNSGQVELDEKEAQRLKQRLNEVITQVEVFEQKAQENVVSKLTEAANYFAKALEIQPDHGDAYYGKASCHALEGQNDDAIANLKQAIDLDPKYREIAKTDADFDGVRSDDRFQALLKD